MTAQYAAQVAKKRDPMIEQRANWWRVGLAVALLGGFCLLVLFPLGSLIAGAFRAPASEPNLIRETLLDAPLQQAILTTLTVGLLAVALASLIAFRLPLGETASRWCFAGFFLCLSMVGLGTLLAVFSEASCWICPAFSLGLLTIGAACEPPDVAGESI